MDVLRDDITEAFENETFVNLVDSIPIAKFIEYKLSTSSGKEIEHFDIAHTVCFLFNLLSSPRPHKGIPIAFKRNSFDCLDGCSNNKTIKDMCISLEQKNIQMLA